MAHAAYAAYAAAEDDRLDIVVGEAVAAADGDMHAGILALVRRQHRRLDGVPEETDAAAA